MSPNVAIISATIAIVTLVFASFGASWLNQRNLERLLDQLEKRFDERLASMEQRFDQRLASIEQRLEQVERQVDQRLDSVDQRLGRIERQLDAIFKPVFPPHT
jgi:tetrahydromethanopterin S-methyltransferase subunit G